MPSVPSCRGSRDACVARGRAISLSNVPAAEAPLRRSRKGPLCARARRALHLQRDPPGGPPDRPALRARLRAVRADDRPVRHARQAVPARPGDDPRPRRAAGDGPRDALLHAQSLVARDLVEVTRAARDGRCRIVSITETGTPVFLAAKARWEAVNAQVDASLGDGALALRQLLKQLETLRLDAASSLRLTAFRAPVP